MANSIFVANSTSSDNSSAVRELLAQAKSVAVLTGAGISAESGVPTFRGDGGLWRNFRAEELATPEAFARDPQMVWEWYESRRAIVAQAQPNAGHLALRKLEEQVPSFCLITQNVDGLHERAGSRNVLRLHGSLWRIRCLVCRREVENHDVPLHPLPPSCPCGGMMRPAVVGFGEELDPVVWDKAWNAVSSAGVLLVVGTSAVVYPAASLIPLAQKNAVKVVEINPDATPGSRFADFCFRGNSGDILPQLLS